MSSDDAKQAEADAVPSRTETQPTPQPMSQPAATAPTRRRSRWYWRWTRRLLIAAVVARVLLWLFLEQLANFGAGFAGLSVSWRSASLSIAGLSLVVEDLVVRDADDASAPPLLTAQEVIADLSMRQLLSGQLSVVDAGVSGARVTVHRNADGTLRLPAAWLQPSPVELPDEPEPPSDEPLDFALPCWIASTRLHDLQFDFVDHTTEPATHHTGKLDLDVADVGFPDRNGSVQLRVHAPQLCDELFVHSQVQAASRAADVTFQAVVRGFRPQRFELPPELLDAIQNAHVVDVRLAGDLHAAVLESAPRVPALEGKLDFGLALDGIERSTLAATFGPTDPTAEGLVTPLGLTLHADGIVESLRLEEARLSAVEGRTGVTATLAAEGLTCVRIRPVLAAAGVQLPDGGLDLRAVADAEFGESMTFDLSRLTIDGKAGRLLSLPKVAVQDLRTVDDTLAIERVELAGPRLEVVKLADGSLQVAGLRIAPPPAGAAPAPPAEPESNEPAAPAATTPSPLPKLRLGAFSWSGVDVSFTDQSKPTPATLTLAGLDVRADALAFGEEAPPGRVQIAFSVPDVARSCRGELTLTPRADGVTARLDWQTQGVTLAGLEPWLDALGMRSELRDGELAMKLEADVQLQPQLAASAQLSDLRLADGTTRWLSLRAIRGEGLLVADDGLHLGTWTVQDPYVELQRDAEQQLRALGLAFGAAAPAGSPAAPAGSPAAPQPAAQPAAASAPPFHLQHGAVEVRGATLKWTDALRPQQSRAVGLDLTIGPQPRRSAPVDITLAMRISDAQAKVDLTANLQRSPERIAASGELTASKLVASELASLLPDGVRCTFDDGTVHAAFDADVALAGATAIDATLREVRITDRDVEAAAIDEVVVDVPTLNPDEVHVRKLRVAGVRASVATTGDELLVPGFALATASAETTQPKAPEQAAEPSAGEQSAGEKPAGEPVADNPTAGSAAPSAPTAQLHLPKVRIDELLVQLERFEFRDRSDGERPPIGASLSLELKQPWLGDPKADEPKPMTLAITGAVDPLGASLRADATANPFDLTPTLDLTLSLDDFDTTRLVELMPSLQDTLRGEAKDLTLAATLHARLDLKRRDPSVLDFSRPFGGELVLEDVVLRDGSSDQVYAKVAVIDAIARAIDPRSGSVLLRSLDIDEPVLRAHKDAEGTHVAGFVLLEPAAIAADQPAPRPAPEPQAAPEGVPASEPTPVPTPTPTPSDRENDFELAIDHLRVLGVAVDYRDQTTEPRTHLHLVDTDLEVSRFSTRAFSEPLPLSFSTTVRGGDIELERRVVKSSVISGFLSSSAEALVGGNDEHELQQRPMLDRMTADGRLTLFPQPKGRINLSVDRLELSAFRGLAKQAGVEISDGLFDTHIALKLKGYDGLEIRSDNVFTWLALDEPPDGPISTYLRLPAPLQTVLFLLRNNDDEQRIPLNVDVPPGPEGQSEVVDRVVESLVKLIGDSIASAGSRTATTITGAFFGTDAEVPDIQAMLPYAPGSPLPDAADLDRILAALLDDDTLVLVLSHQLGEQDVPHARELANPPRDVLEGTVAGLQRTRAELETRRAPIAQDVVALYGAGKVQEAIRRQQELLAIDTHLGELLQALSGALEQLGNPNPRAAARRTRSACKALGEARLDAAIARIRSLHKNLGADRFERRPGRGVPVAGVVEGGCVIASLKRRSTQAPVSK
ncbi:MAG: DUF748 domain-containing protein [Planctomycetota bacterium]